MATKRRQAAKRKKPAKASKQSAGRKKKLVRAASKKRRSSAAGAKARDRKASARKKSAPKAAATAAPKKSATAKKAAKAVAPRKAKAIAPKKIAVSEKRPAAPPPAAPSVAVARPPKRKAPIRKQSGTGASRHEQQPARTPYYITTAISYPNGPPHIGHAYEVIATDAIARFHRLDGYDVLFSTGTDEHGLKIQQAATRAGTTPRAYVDGTAARFQAMADRMDCAYDRFIRTTEPGHYE